jgi:hypothetical protein
MNIYIYSVEKRPTKFGHVKHFFNCPSPKINKGKISPNLILHWSVLVLKNIFADNCDRNIGPNP